MSKLILVRGVPGSGKTTLCQKMYDDHEIDIWQETDNYWMRPDGTYDYNAKYISEAHQWCYDSVKWWVARGNTIAVANTFTRLWEMERYIKLAKEFKYELKVIRCTGEYENIHGCPPETVQKMKDRFEDYKEEELGV